MASVAVEMTKASSKTTPLTKAEKAKKSGLGPGPGPGPGILGQMPVSVHIRRMLAGGRMRGRGCARPRRQAWVRIRGSFADVRDRWGRHQPQPVWRNLRAHPRPTHHRGLQTWIWTPPHTVEVSEAGVIVELDVSGGRRTIEKLRFTIPRPARNPRFPAGRRRDAECPTVLRFCRFGMLTPCPHGGSRRAWFSSCAWPAHHSLTHKAPSPPIPRRSWPARTTPSSIVTFNAWSTSSSLGSIHHG